MYVHGLSNNRTAIVFPYTYALSRNKHWWKLRNLLCFAYPLGLPCSPYMVGLNCSAFNYFHRYKAVVAVPVVVPISYHIQIKIQVNLNIILIILKNIQKCQKPSIYAALRYFLVIILIS